MMYRFIVVAGLVCVAAGCGDDSLVCPSIACEPKTVSVITADGALATSFSGTVTVDGVSLRVACPATNGSDLDCVDGGFVVAGRPRSLTVALTSTGLCGAASLQLTYPTHDEPACNASCELPLEPLTVTLQECASPSARALVVTSTEGPGPHCDYAGTRIDSGNDTDGNGVLDTAEITTTTYVCDEDPWTTTYFGNIVIADAEDLARYASVKLVLGNLTVEGTLGDIPSIEAVTGEVTVRCPPERTRLAFSALRHVVGAVRAGGCFNGDLIDLELPLLETSGGLGVNDGVVSVAAPKLRELSSLYLIGSSIAALDLPSLVRLDGVTAQENSVLDECSVLSIMNRIYKANGGHILSHFDRNVACDDVDIRCPALTIGGDSFRVCYRASSAAEADAFCSGLGAGWGLAFVTGPDELDAFMSTPILYDLWTLWISYTDVATEGTFVWPRQKPGVTYAPQNSSEGLWAGGWPNGGDGEDCVALNRGATFEALDHPCDVGGASRPLCRYLAQ